MPTAADVEKTLRALRASEEESAAQALAAQLQLPHIQLLGFPIEGATLSLIPEAQAERLRLVAYLKSGRNVKVASDHPQNPELQPYLAELGQPQGLTFELALASRSSIDYSLSLYLRLPRVTLAAVAQSADPLLDIKNLGDLQARIREVPTTKLFDLLFRGALVADSSDIHLEPTEEILRVRYRIDGVLQDIVSLPLAAHKALVSRIKNLAKLKLDLVTAPQDGSFTLPGGSATGEVDVRVSTLPSAYGEAVVMRLLKQGAALIGLEQMGIRTDALAMIREAASKPNGMIIVTGPTGSGKSTTLYAVLQEQNKPGVKIITLEDPVEYRISGIEQSEVDPEQNYTFASGLRAILRQDPDIIMVGEIRDEETATIAVNAALTGHLVLTTLHTNDAPSAFARLIDIGVKPFLLSGSINLVTAQRLIRRLCQACREAYTPSEQEVATIKQLLPNAQIPAQLFRAKGCPTCHSTGYKGRMSIVEVLKFSPELEKLVVSKATITELQAQAVKQGMLTLAQDGILKVLEGQTTFDEVWRVTKG